LCGATSFFFLKVISLKKKVFFLKDVVQQVVQQFDLEKNFNLNLIVRIVGGPSPRELFTTRLL